MTMTAGSFDTLGIAPTLLAVVQAMKFNSPTPIQEQAIPLGVQGRDLIGIAQTGTGKTLAFGIPMVQRLAASNRCGLVLVPTRELAIQVNEVLVRLTPAVRLRTAVLIGGESMYTQIQRLREDPRIIIATPGRLNDHLNRGLVHLDQVGVLVLDEADRMLDMGFYPQIERVLKEVPRDRQTMLFSATLPASIMRLAASHLQDPVRVEVAPSGTAAATVSQQMFVVNHGRKADLLGELLKDYQGPVLLFVRTKRSAGRVAEELRGRGHAAAEIHADRTLIQRKNALRGFKSGQFRVLVATDIAARGIDVTGIELVVNYDLPDDPENYVHRIGRTGRAGLDGHAITLATPDQGQEVRQIEKILRTSIPVAQHPEIPTGRFALATAPQAGRAAGRGGPGSRSGRRPQGASNGSGPRHGSFSFQPRRRR